MRKSTTIIIIDMLVRTQPQFFCVFYSSSTPCYFHCMGFTKCDECTDSVTMSLPPLKAPSLSRGLRTRQQPCKYTTNQSNSVTRMFNLSVLSKTKSIRVSIVGGRRIGDPNYNKQTRRTRRRLPTSIYVSKTFS